MLSENASRVILYLPDRQLRTETIFILKAVDAHLAATGRQLRQRVARDGREADQVCWYHYSFFKLSRGRVLC
jgi:hypothetical protein